MPLSAQSEHSGQTTIAVAMLSRRFRPWPIRTTRMTESVTPPGSGSAIAKVFEQMLPAGDFRKVNAITVSYAAGGKSPKHRHDVAVFAYVLEGDVESQLEGEELKTFHKGEMWYEPPGTIHVVSRNASATKPAKLLVFLVQEEGKAATTLR